MLDEPLELEAATNTSIVPEPVRRHLDEPPPVRLVAIADLRVEAMTDDEAALDKFYVDLLGFERDPTEWAYRAHKFRLRFVAHKLPRSLTQPIRVEVPSLENTAERLLDRHIDYQWQRRDEAASDELVLVDPAGHNVVLFEAKRVM